MSQTAEAPATASALASLEVRTARIESDVAHIQRDVSDLKADMKTVVATLARLEATLARLEERTVSFATREWVMWRMMSAFLLLIAVLVAVVGYAPRLQSFLGTATPPTVAAPAR